MKNRRKGIYINNMSVAMKWVFIIFLLATSIAGLAQKITDEESNRRDTLRVTMSLPSSPRLELEGCVITQEGNPIPYPIVENITLFYYVGNVGTSNGCFTVEAFTSNLADTVIRISALGYNDTVVTPASLQNSPEVSLSEKLTSIQPLVKNGYQEAEDLILGVTRKCKYICKRAYYGRHPGYQVGIFINNEHNAPLRVSKVEAYIVEGGLPGAPLRLRIYRLDSITEHYAWGEIQFQHPGENLLLSQQIERVKHGGEWLIFDLEESNVYIPKEGAVFALEYINSGAEYYHGPYGASGSRSYGPGILVSYDKEALPFLKTYLRWRKHPSTTKIGNRYRAPTIRVHCKKPIMQTDTDP